MSGLEHAQRCEAEAIRAAQGYEGMARFQRRQAVYWHEQAAWWSEMSFAEHRSQHGPRLAHLSTQRYSDDQSA